MTDPTIPVPVDVSTEQRHAPELLEYFHPHAVVLVGWYPVPDQTALEQMRDEHEAEAVERIEAVAAEFPDDGAAVRTVVVFTRDRAETVDRVADDYDCEAVLVPRDVRRVERVLVPIRGDQNLDAILAFVGGLCDENDASVTLFHAVPESEEDPSVGEVLLEGAAEELVAAGVDTDRIATETVTTHSAADAIFEAAADHDILVLGETEPSIVEHIIGTVPSQVIDRTDKPVLVVRKTG